MSNHIELKGTVTKSLPGRNFEVEVQAGKTLQKVICAMKGKLYKNKISVVPGDEVKVELSQYDLTKGFIAQRVNKKVNADRKSVV